MKDLFCIDEKVIVITGSSKGIGFEIAKSMSCRGAKVIGLSRTTPEEEYLFDHRCCDITDKNLVSKIIDEIFESYGKIDVLINCAGSTSPSNQESIEKRYDNFIKTFDINLNSAFFLTDKVSLIMKKQKSGSIINITSIAAEFGFANNPSYVSSKGALKQMSKAMAVDLGDHGIRVNCICPGYIRTDMTEKSFNNETLHEERLRNMIIPRWGSPNDLVGAAIFLSSDASSYVTGSDLVVDGGWCAKGMS